MKRTVLFIALIICIGAKAQNITSTDFWQEDKIKHSIGSFGISTATYTFLSIHNKYKEFPELKKRLISLSTTMLVGSIKEMIDSASSGNASWGDMGANAVGGLAFQAAITIPINFNNKHKRKKKTTPSSNSPTDELVETEN
ncbi:hypothetical protein ABW636_05450 [Aquimarina sp. 2201CG1-2-11]|uniref:hypothetical protein n=1 Tax=Aquimarina discodermiae TaxID=3231043 RepID=UPI0034633E52